jgi:hypothetical protein
VLGYVCSLIGHTAMIARRSFLRDGLFRPSSSACFSSLIVGSHFSVGSCASWMLQQHGIMGTGGCKRGRLIYHLASAGCTSKG